MRTDILKKFKKEPVLAASAVCMLLSMLFVPPSAAYISYMVKNEYRQPSNEELNACVDYVTKNQVNDFFKRS